MTATAGVQIYGVKEAIKELRNIDPEYRKQLNRDAKEVAAPAVNDARSQYPAQFLSGMKYQWAPRGKVKFPYDQSKAQRGVTIKVDTAKRNQGTIVIIQKDPAASIIDMAGKAGGRGRRGMNFVNQMMRFGPPSRIMWPAYERNANEIEANMVVVIEQVMEQVNRNMVTP
jgi:hypothetical protein